MTRAEALSWGYCPRCASYTPTPGDERHGCSIMGVDCCQIDPHYGEWLRQTFRLKGPVMADDLGIFDGMKSRGSKWP